MKCIYASNVIVEKKKKKRNSCRYKKTIEPFGCQTMTSIDSSHVFYHFENGMGKIEMSYDL